MLPSPLFRLTITFALAAIAPALCQEPPMKRGPEVILDRASEDIFPEVWRTPKINAKAEPLAESERERCRTIVEQSLARYPADLLAATLKKVYCLGRLEYSGAVTGGTRSSSAIYVVCKPTYSVANVEGILHAEYSSILFQKFPHHFDKEAWQRLNPPDFRYLGGGVQAVKSGRASGRFDDATHEQGFIHEYAKASIEEDFNSHAARLLRGEPKYWDAIEKHPKLRAKADLVMAFYAKVHARFTTAAFQSLRKKPDATAADPSQLTLERIFTTEDFKDEKLKAILWSKIGAHYFTLETPLEGKSGKDLVRHDVKSGAKTVLVSAQAMTPPGAKKPLSVDSFEFSQDESQVLLFASTKKVWRKNTRGDYWHLDLVSKQLRKVGGDAAPSTLMFAKFSPDGTRVAYVCKNNLHVQSLADLKITPLTSDGSGTLINGTSDWVNEEELGLRDCFRWSPDGTRLLFWQFDTKDVKRFSMVNQTSDSYQRFTTFPYPKAGEKNSAVRLGIVSTGGGDVRWLDIAGDSHEHYLPQAEWTPDGTGVLLHQFNRLQNILRVMLADAKTGTTKIVLTETDEAWVENKNTVEWMGDDFLWLSERSGWRQVYRVNLAGEVKPLTQGAWDVIDVARLDAKDGWLYYIASPDNPTQRYLYRVSVEGGESQRLSPAQQSGTHAYDISEDVKFAVHTHSSMTSPPVIQLVSLPDHHTIRVLQPQTELIEKIAKLKLPKTEFLRVDIGGMPFDAWCITAADFDARQKHPLLIHVYGEPAGQTVKDAWGGQRMLWHWMLAQQGYVVASVDTRGTASPRGRDWRKSIYRQLGIVNSQDHAAATRALLKRFEFVDPQRVGIWGWSGGGGSSLDAIFRYPDLYSTAIAVAPVPDRRLYDSIYEERYMGLPKDNTKGYLDGSPITHAKSLKGNLLIIHGTGDDNVHYQGTEKLINELVAHNKPFTVMPYPNRDHAIKTGKGTSRHLHELMTRYLHEHLPVR